MYITYWSDSLKCSSSSQVIETKCLPQYLSLKKVSWNSFSHCFSAAWYDLLSKYLQLNSSESTLFFCNSIFNSPPTTKINWTIADKNCCPFSICISTCLYMFEITSDTPESFAEQTPFISYGMTLLFLVAEAIISHRQRITMTQGLCIFLTHK